MSTISIPRNLNDRIASAIELFWATRSGQIARQNQAGTRDQGNRGAVTGGKQLDGFVELIKDVLILNGVPERCIFIDTDLELQVAQIMEYIMTFQERTYPVENS